MPKKSLAPKQKIDPALEAEAKRQRLLVKDVLYPWLLTHTKSVEEAKNFLQIAAMLVKENYTAKIDKRVQELEVEEKKRFGNLKFDEMGLVKEFKKEKTLKEILPIFDLFKDETVFVASSLISGMGKAIESFEKKEMMKRKLETLETDFL